MGTGIGDISMDGIAGVPAVGGGGGPGSAGGGSSASGGGGAKAKTRTTAEEQARRRSLVWGVRTSSVPGFKATMGTARPWYRPGRFERLIQRTTPTTPQAGFRAGGHPTLAALRAPPKLVAAAERGVAEAELTAGAFFRAIETTASDTLARIELGRMETRRSRAITAGRMFTSSGGLVPSPKGMKRAAERARLSAIRVAAAETRKRKRAILAAIVSQVPSLPGSRIRRTGGTGLV